MTPRIRSGHIRWLPAVFMLCLMVTVAAWPSPALAQGTVVAGPRGLTTDGVGCLTPAGSRVTGSGPLLAGVPLSTEAAVRARVEVRTATGSTNLRTWLSEAATAGQEIAWQLDGQLADGPYRWRMRSEPAAGGVSPWSGWCEFTVDASRDGEPEPEPPGEVACPVAVTGDEPLAAADESAALLLAQACDAVTEAMSVRDFGARVLARPDGVLVAEQYTQPQWARDTDGEWTGIDPTFQAGTGGRLSTVATVSTIEVSGGGSDPFVTATDPDGGAVSLSWPDPLPAPVVEGETVTYPEVFEDVDLQVTAGSDGFSYVLVVKSAVGAANPALASVSVGIEAGGGLAVGQETDGTVVAADPGGEAVFSAPAGYMWDSSEPEPAGSAPAVAAADEGSGLPGDGGPGRFTEMPLDLTGSTLTIEPDQDLLSDPEVEFPVMIDPPFSGKRTHWANVHQQQPTRGWTDDSRWPTRARDAGRKAG